MKYLPIAMLIALSTLGCDSPNNKTTDNSLINKTANTSIERDNTAVNKRDRDVHAKTPLDQNENTTDIGITADIRKRVVDTEMSVNAQNVKIITQDGKVTPRGPVQSVDEKNEIEKMAPCCCGRKER